MDARQRGKVERTLRDKRAELLAAGPQKIEPNRKDVATSGVADDDEQALSEMLQALASTRNRENAALIASIDHALHKLRDEPDDFGACEDCGEDIALPRLNAKPFAQFCIGCQAKADGPKTGPTRKKLTDYR